MYNNFVPNPNQVSGEQAILTATSGNNSKMNTINFSENPMQNQFGAHLETSPDNFVKT